MTTADALTTARRLKVSGGRVEEGLRVVPEETPIAITYGRASCAVMMATPADLEDFAIGFSLSEGIILTKDAITELEIVPHETGFEARMWLVPERQSAFLERRRFMAGPGGCGLCGIESLDAAYPTLPRVAPARTFSPEMVAAAVASLGSAQVLNQASHAVHAAGFWTPEHGLAALREDVGRHNALDKLAGALARTGTRLADGITVLTSRVSIELVQKAARLGLSFLAAVSAPTATAIRLAERTGLTLVAIARGDGFEIFSHSTPILGKAGFHAA